MRLLGVLGVLEVLEVLGVQDVSDVRRLLVVEQVLLQRRPGGV